MLTKLFSSPVRVKILKILTMHADNSFNAAEIAVATGSIVRSVNKEMVKLVEVGAVIEESKDVSAHGKNVKLKYYHVNKDFVIFEEIKAIFLKIQIVDLENLKEKIIKLGKINYVLLTGNFVGNEKARIDLLIVGQADQKKMENFVKDFQKKMGWELNWAHMELSEYDYRQKIGDIFLFDILAGKKIEVYSKFV